MVVEHAVVLSLIQATDLARGYIHIMEKDTVDQMTSQKVHKSRPKSYFLFSVSLQVPLSMRNFTNDES